MTAARAPESPPAGENVTHGYRGSVRLAVPSRRWVVGLGWPIALALVLRVMHVSTSSLALAMSLWIGLGLVVPLIVLRLAWSRMGREEVYGALEIDSEAIRFDGAPILLRETLIEGVIVPGTRGAPSRVHLKSSASRSLVRMVPRDDYEAQRILKALELDARNRSMEHRIPSGVRGLTPFRRFHTRIGLLIAALGIGLALSLHGIWLLAIYPALLLACISISALFIETRIRVGADGVSLSWLLWHRFVRIADIARASRVVAIRNGALLVCVELLLQSGELLVLPMGGADRESDALLVARRIEEAALAQRARPSGTRSSSVLRQGRSPLGWVTHLRTIGTGANADMRNAPVTKDELFDLVEDANESPSARVSAAIALSRVLNPYERKRIRIAGRSSASIDLRAALERAADAEASEAELAQILVRVDALRAGRRVR